MRPIHWGLSEKSKFSSFPTINVSYCVKKRFCLVSACCLWKILQFLCFQIRPRGDVLVWREKSCFPNPGSSTKQTCTATAPYPMGSGPDERIKEEYQKRGYSIIAFTDHMTYQRHTQLDSQDFLTIAAFEANVDAPASRYPDWNTRPVYHLNFYDTCPEGRDPPLCLCPSRCIPSKT